MRNAAVALLLVPLLGGGCYSHFVFPTATPEELVDGFQCYTPTGNGAYRSVPDDNDLAYGFRWCIRIGTLGLVWPTRERRDWIIEPAPGGGSVFSMRVLEHSQLFYVIPFIWTHGWEEQREADYLSEYTGKPYRER